MVGRNDDRHTREQRKQKQSRTMIISLTLNRKRRMNAHSKQTENILPYDNVTPTLM